MPTTPQLPCEFFLIRYVPDVVKGEFTNIGVLLREVRDPDAEPSSAPSLPKLRFTRDWTRVQCMHAGADTEMLEALEAEMVYRLETEPSDPATYPKRLLESLTDSLSNSIQISEPRACLAESLVLELEQLMTLYVEPLKIRGEKRPRSGRAAITAAMRSAFESTGAWGHMRKRIAASQYTHPGDPLKLDCGYACEVPNEEREAGSREDIIRIFHAVSLENDVESARSLAFTAPRLREGVIQSARISFSRANRRWVGLEFELAAVVEPLRALSESKASEAEEEDFSDEASGLYRFGVDAMESAGIRVLTVNNLAAAAERARTELRL